MTTHHATPTLPKTLRGAARRLGRDEDGSMIVFGLFLFLMMLMVGGMAVDLMRYETHRTRLQATLDRAILAASDLDQTEDPEAVLRDYFRAAGLLDQIASVEVTEALNSRTVTATAAMELDTFFMDLVGVETLAAPAAGRAEESVHDIEIVLVLDVSSSMGQNNRLVDLQAAAREFVQIVRENDTKDRVSIAIVPFDAQVNLGEDLLGRYNVTEQHGNSSCIELPASVYTSPRLSTTLAMPQAGFFDPNSSTSQVDRYVAPETMRPTRAPCKPLAANEVLLPIQDVATLQARIDELVLGEGTAITLGMKWGLALIDPGSRDMFADAIADGDMPGTLAERPYDYGGEDTLKVIVLMTDGSHSETERLRTGFRTELSPIYRGTDGNYSIHHPARPGDNKFWVPHLDNDGNTSNGRGGVWRRTAWDGTPDEDSDGPAGPDTDTDGAGTVAQLRWPEVWSSVRMSWVAWHLYARPLCPAGGGNGSCRTPTYDSWMDVRTPGGFKTSPTASDMDDDLQQSCGLARDNGVVVYGIAFEAPTRGQTQIRDCSFTRQYYFNARNGEQLRANFRTIASQINALRLTQ